MRVRHEAASQVPPAYNERMRYLVTARVKWKMGDEPAWQTLELETLVASTLVTIDHVEKAP